MKQMSHSSLWAAATISEGSVYSTHTGVRSTAAATRRAISGAGPVGEPSGPWPVSSSVLARLSAMRSDSMCVTSDQRMMNGFATEDSWAIHTDLVWTYSIIPSMPDSRPRPLRFQPPNGELKPTAR